MFYKNILLWICRRGRLQHNEKNFHLFSLCLSHNFLHLVGSYRWNFPHSSLMIIQRIEKESFNKGVLYINSFIKYGRLASNCWSSKIERESSQIIPEICYHFFISLRNLTKKGQSPSASLFPFIAEIDLENQSVVSSDMVSYVNNFSDSFWVVSDSCQTIENETETWEWNNIMVGRESQCGRKEQWGKDSEGGPCERSCESNKKKEMGKKHSERTWEI